MTWMQTLRADPIPWLLEANDPGPRYLALRDLLDRPADDPELVQARQAAHTEGPIATILDHMQEEGYWEEPGAGYRPKYTSTVWSVINLAQLGAVASQDPRIGRAMRYVLEHALTEAGQFTASGAPSATADCLQGNLCASLLDLGCPPERLDTAFEWMARTVTGEGLAPKEQRDAPLRYYAGQCGPLFACGSNMGLSCAWGGAKVMSAFARWPMERRTPLVQRAIDAGIEFFLQTDPATADYPCGLAPKPSTNWWKFGFPVFYVTDILQIVEAMVELGRGSDPRLANALQLVRDKQDEQGRWPLEYSYSGKVWVDYGPKKQPNKWVTLRALRALKGAAETAGEAGNS